MGAFGGSFLNHFWLVCACTPKYPNADQSPAKGQIAILEDDGISLKLAEDSPKSALEGTPAIPIWPIASGIGRKAGKDRRRAGEASPKHSQQHALAAPEM
jgi:hypothetical protein